MHIWISARREKGRSAMIARHQSKPLGARGRRITDELRTLPTRKMERMHDQAISLSVGLRVDMHRCVDPTSVQQDLALTLVPARSQRAMAEVSTHTRRSSAVTS